MKDKMPIVSSCFCYRKGSTLDCRAFLMRLINNYKIIYKARKCAISILIKGRSQNVKQTQLP